jgi:hypothetical protein
VSASRPTVIQAFHHELHIVPISLYIDVSGHEDDQRAVVAAGYVAAEEHWIGFERQWAETLVLAGAPYFHATYFFACKRKFKHLIWGSARHSDLGRRFARTAYEQLPHGCSYAIDCDHFAAELGSVFAKAKTPHDRMPAAMLAVSALCDLAAQKWLPPEGPTAAVLIEDGTGVGEIVEWLLHLQRVGEPWTRAYHSFRRVPKSDYRVQAADFLAHEAWLESESVMKDPSRGWNSISRETFKTLATGPLMLSPEFGTAKVDLRYATRDNFRHAAPELESFLKSHPEYRGPPWWHRWRSRLRRWGRSKWRSLQSFAIGRYKKYSSRVKTGASR